MPDLDLRLMACAGAARRATPHMIDCVAVARAVIDEWLKQEASAGMITAAFVPGCLTAEAGDSATIATYTAMCLQARREIAG